MVWFTVGGRTFVGLKVEANGVSGVGEGNVWYGMDAGACGIYLFVTILWGRGRRHVFSVLTISCMYEKNTKLVKGGRSR